MTITLDRAKHMVGNWRHFESFLWFDKPDDAEQWTIVYTVNRDSEVIDQSNHAVISRELAPFMDAGDVVRQHMTHWACGWIDGFAIRVFDTNGNVTPAFEKWHELSARIEEYPILDEDDLSRREQEAEQEDEEATEPITQPDWNDPRIS